MHTSASDEICRPRYILSAAQLLDGVADYQPGQQLKVDEMFKEGDIIDVAGTSIGKGFQGERSSSIARLVVRAVTIKSGSFDYRCFTHSTAPVHQLSPGLPSLLMPCIYRLWRVQGVMDGCGVGWQGASSGGAWRVAT